MPSTVKISVEAVGFQQSLEKQIAAATRGGSGGLKIPINDKAFNTALNGMNGNLRRFEQSLDISNRRVIAFGTSASVVYGIVRGFKELVNATVQVEKTMTSINSIFGLSARSLDTFSKSLFNVARLTGQSFDEVSKAAEELARQGLGVEETLKRTRDAMILVRLTGLDAAKSVEVLTAAVNTFGRAGEDTTSILNKLVAVDQRFAVSTKDIAEAFQRVGSVAEDAGVSVEQFAGLVAAAKQITSRDGAVIGNSLKTIFTRLERSSTLDDLEALGIAVRDVAGNAKPALAVFNELAQSYKSFGRDQQQQIAELGGGVFQINQFKALLLDLGKANGVAAQATRAATGATNDALIRNAALNDTMATSLQNLKTSATQAAAVTGSLALKPILKEGVDFGNVITGLFRNAKATGDTKAAEDFGAYLGESILKGVGNVLAGPGLVFAAKAIVGVLGRTLPEVLGDVKSSAGLFPGPRPGVAEGDAIQRTNALISLGTKEEQARYVAAKAVADQEAIILGILERQAAVYYATIGKAAGATGGYNVRTGRRTPGAAEGYLPMGAESAAIAAGVGGAPSSARPVYLPSFNRGGGQRGIVANTSEFVVPGAAGGAIFNRDMIRRHGLPPGATPVAAGGYVPNAAGGFNDLPMQLGSEYGLRMGAQNIAKLEGLFANLSKAATITEASQFGPQIIDLAKSLDKVSEKGVLRQVAREFDRITFASKIITDQGARVPYVPPTGGGRGDDYIAMTARNAARIANRDPLEQRLQAADLEKDRAIYRAKQDRAVLERANARERFSGRLQNAALAGSFASAFLPQGISGETSGKASGALSGGLQSAAFGAFLGSVGGPAGTIIGTIVGGLGGAIKGFLDRAEKSFDEVAQDVTKQTSKLKEQIDATGAAFEAQDRIVEAKTRGAPALQIARLQGQFNTSLARVGSPELQRLIASGDPEARQQAAEQQASEVDRVAKANAIKLAFTKGREDQGGLGSFLGRLYNPFDKRSLALPYGAETVGNAADALQASYADLSDSELAGVAKRIRGPQYENQGFTQDATIGAINREVTKRTLLREVDQERLAAAGPSPILGSESLALSARISLRGQLSQISAGGANQIGSLQNQALLANPSFTDLDRLLFSGQINRKAIRDQFATQGASALSEGTSSLIGGLSSQGVRGRAIFERISSATGKDDLSALLRDLPGSKLLAGASDPSGAFKATERGIQDLIARLTVLNATEEQAIKVSDETNRLDLERLNRSRSLEGARDEDIGAIHALTDALNAANARREDPETRLRALLDLQSAQGRSDVRGGSLSQRQFDTNTLRGSLDLDALRRRRSNRSVIDLVQQGSSLVDGASIEGAVFDNANTIGREGDSRGSLAGGFKSSFAGARQELRNLAEVGREVGASLQSNLGNAFGDFVTGAKSAKDAFRSFALGVLGDAARVFASKAVSQLLGLLFGSVSGVNVTSTGAGAALAVAGGGPIQRASGGSIPTLLTGGEYVYGPGAASRLGSRNLRALNSGVARFAPGGLVKGGSGVRDDVFQPLSPGSFVIRKAMVERYGADNLATLAMGGYPDIGDNMSPTALRMATGGDVSTMMAAPTTYVPTPGAAGGGTFNIGVTINDQSTKTESSGGPNGGSQFDRQFGETMVRRMKQVALQTIEEQKRMGGTLRPQSNLFPS